MPNSGNTVRNEPKGIKKIAYQLEYWKKIIEHEAVEHELTITVSVSHDRVNRPIKITIKDMSPGRHGEEGAMDFFLNYLNLYGSIKELHSRFHENREINYEPVSQQHSPEGAHILKFYLEKESDAREILLKLPERKVLFSNGVMDGFGNHNPYIGRADLINNYVIPLFNSENIKDKTKTEGKKPEEFLALNFKPGQHADIRMLNRAAGSNIWPFNIIVEFRATPESVFFQKEWRVEDIRKYLDAETNKTRDLLQSGDWDENSDFLVGKVLGDKINIACNDARLLKNFFEMKRTDPDPPPGKERVFREVQIFHDGKEISLEKLYKIAEGTKNNAMQDYLDKKGGSWKDLIRKNLTHGYREL